MITIKAFWINAYHFQITLKSELPEFKNHSRIHSDENYIFTFYYFINICVECLRYIDWIEWRIFNRNRNYQCNHWMWIMSQSRVPWYNQMAAASNNKIKSSIWNFKSMFWISVHSFSIGKLKGTLWYPK